MPPFEIVTSRLTLQEWRDEDLDAFAAMNRDPRVMEFFPSLLSRQQSDDLARRFQQEFERRRFCPWPVRETEHQEFVGFVGLHEVNVGLPFAPAVEVGWRLAQKFWGRGFASEAAAASVAYGFDQLGLDEVVSMTSLLNERSQAVMVRLGMTRDPREDFEHPSVPQGNRLRPHVLYRLHRRDWEARAAS